MPIDPADDDDFVDQWADPESDESLGDPDRSISIPNAPSVPDYEAVVDSNSLESDLSSVDDELLNAFVVCVVLINAGVILVSIGFLLVMLRGQHTLGGVFLLAAAVAFVRVVHHYREYERTRSDDTDPTEHNR